MIAMNDKELNEKISFKFNCNRKSIVRRTKTVPRTKTSEYPAVKKMVSKILNWFQTVTMIANEHKWSKTVVNGYKCLVTVTNIFKRSF